MACAAENEDSLQSRITTDSTTSVFNPFALGPEIHGESTFDFERNTNVVSCADNLASEAKNLIDLFKRAAPPQIQNQFQIELRKTHCQEDQSSRYKMVLRIDSVLWFDDQEHRCANLKELYDIALRYGEKVKKEVVHFPGIDNEKEIQRVPIDSSKSDWCVTEKQGQICRNKSNGQRPCTSKHYEWCPDENWGLSGECTGSKFGDHVQRFSHTLTINEENPPPYDCRKRSLNLDRKYVWCSFRVNPDFWIHQGKVEKPSKYPYFVVGARPDATPIITLNPVKHCENEEYVQSSDAWQAVLQTLTFIKSKLELETFVMNRISVNFGKWMTQKSDPMNRDCHAHINIELTRETIEKITESNFPSETSRESAIFSKKKPKQRTQKLFPSLAGSLLPAKVHSLDDARRLITHANNSIAPLLKGENQELRKTISVLQIQLETLQFAYEQSRKSISDHIQIGQELDDATGDEVADEILSFGACNDDITRVTTN